MMQSLKSRAVLTIEIWAIEIILELYIIFCLTIKIYMWLTRTSLFY